jgi:co-chaperonin GroES (HSP10)
MKLIEFNKKVKCNAEFVSVRIINNQEEVKVGNIYLPSNTHNNDRLALGCIEDVGDKAAEEYGLAVGQYVMFDRLSTFAHTAPIALLRYNNVICFTDENQENFSPLKGMLFVIPKEQNETTQVGNIFVTEYKDKLNLGTIEKINVTDKAADLFKVNDTVMLTKGADVIRVNDKVIHIYKEDMIICKIVDGE